MHHAEDSRRSKELPRHLRLPRPANEPLRDGTPVEAERAILVGVLLPHTKADLNNPLAELAALAESAGATVVDSMVQKRTAIAANTALGKGKLQELAERAEANEADVAIFDIELTPRQIRRIEQVVQRKIIDRSELILDIFASRAQTREAKLQVELAQLQYTAPRLRGLWTHLERIAGAGGATSAGTVGGVGTRGPGERQIEIDRRLVRSRISILKRELEEIDQRKQQEVRSRKDEFTVSLVGYTNSGKTTLFNKLTEAGQFAADQLFATLETKTARWGMGEGQHVLLSDTVGFVRDIPHHLVASFRATLEETIHADLLLHVVDASSPTAFAQVEAVNEVLDEIGCAESKRITLLNKMDITQNQASVHMIALREQQTLNISAQTGEGLDELRNRIAEALRGRVAKSTVLIPHSAGKLLAEIDRYADVSDRRYTNDGVELDIVISKSLLTQLCGRHDELKVIKGDLPVVDDFDEEFGL